MLVLKVLKFKIFQNFIDKGLLGTKMSLIASVRSKHCFINSPVMITGLAEWTSREAFFLAEIV